jgi:predicted nucleic acid-binding protein
MIYPAFKSAMAPAVGLSVLEEIGRVVEPVDRSLYEDFENLARERVLTRDPHDWPIVAVALLLDFPIWTEDQDFFGSDVATLGPRTESSCIYVES